MGGGQSKSRVAAAPPPSPPIPTAPANFGISGKTVVVTGGSRGIGKGIARVFAAAGAKVLICSRHLSEGEATAKELADATGAKVSAIEADVSSLEQMEAVAKAAEERYGGLDILCANAGFFPQTKIESLSVDEWDNVLAVNLKGSFVSVKVSATEPSVTNEPSVAISVPKPNVVDDRRPPPASHHLPTLCPVAGVPAIPQEERAAESRADLEHHGAHHRLPGLVALRREQGGPARLHAHGGGRAR